MTNDKSYSHMSRITNCLQTILDLEPQLATMEIGKTLLEEFSVLKEFLAKIADVDLSEEDVRRIERATDNFLRELEGLMGRQQGGSARSGRLQ